MILHCYKPKELLKELRKRLEARPFIARLFPAQNAHLWFQLISFTDMIGPKFLMRYGMPGGVRESSTAFKLLRRFTFEFSETVAARQLAIWMGNEDTNAKGPPLEAF